MGKDIDVFTDIVILIHKHIREYEKKIEEANQAIRDSYAELQTNVDWAKAKRETFKAKKEALERLLSELG